MTPGDRDAAAPILRAVAEIVLSRPGAAHLPGDASWLVRERTPWLLQVLRRSPAVRARVAKSMAGARLRGRARHLATLLLNPDNAVVEATLDWLGQSASSQARALGHANRTISDLKKKLKAERQRRQYAQEEAREAGKLLDETRASMAELEERVDKLVRQLAVAQHRLQDPQTAAAALLHALERPPAPRDDAASRDPHGGTAPPERYNDVLLAASAAASLTPEELLAAVRAVVDPTPPVPRVEVVEELGLRVTPLGGDTEIGGSCLLVEAGGTRILVDAGVRTFDGRTLPPRDIERALEGELHAVVVTHAHNDHCGYVPALVAQSPRLRILATPETVRLMPMMWEDTVKVMREQDRSLASWGSAATVLYGPAEVEAAAHRCEEVPFTVPRRIGELTVELFPAGHILGAAGAVIRAGDRRIVVTGDISGFRQESVDGYTLPDSSRGADLLVMETTCCGDTHDDRELRVGDFVREVQEICQGGGRVLIPAFALGRAQEIALILRRYLPEVPLRIDGMAADLSAAFEAATADSAHPLKIFGDSVAVADRPAELDTFRTGVIITTSGMLTGGPAVQWAARILPEPSSALFISGYQDEESPGARLRKLAEEGGGNFTLPDRSGQVTVQVKAHVATMRVSAHADRRGLLNIADEVGAHQTMLVHGLPNRQRRFREVLRLRDHDTTGTALWRPA
mgnify:FL=1